MFDLQVAPMINSKPSLGDEERDRSSHLQRNKLPHAFVKWINFALRRLWARLTQRARAIKENNSFDVAMKVYSKKMKEWNNAVQQLCEENGVNDNA
ncbi:hypothetical protein HDV05_004928, partial [Chytridiales sp. JEL 0842]